MIFLQMEDEPHDFVGLSKPNKAASNNQKIPHMYRQDVVKSNSSGMIGIVTEVAGDTDSDSSTTDGEDWDSDDEDDNGENEEEDSDGNSKANGVSDVESGGGESGPLPANQL